VVEKRLRTTVPEKKLPLEGLGETVESKTKCELRRFFTHFYENVFENWAS